MTLQLSIGEASAAGPRPENQDAIRVVTPNPTLAASKGYLFALADGVSQCADGGLAARASLQALAMDYYATPETWAVAQALDRLLLAQNRWLQANGGGQPLLTTLTALVLRGRRFTLAHVGDCRAYRWRDGQLQRLTEEHVWEQPGMRHVLKRALGLDQHLLVDYRDGDLQEADAFLLVSDGVWATLGDQGIRRILVDEQDSSVASRALVRAAHLAGSRDNASALLVRAERLPEGSLADSLARLQHWPAPPALREGQSFEGWRVDGLLAESRQSLVYRVRDSHERRWLLKTLPPTRHSKAEAGQALLLEEWFLRRVASRYFPEIAPLPQRQHLYYVQREYPGKTLAEHLQAHGPLTLAQWLDLAPACCARSACCTDATSCTATSSRKTCYGARTASCACSTSAWPTARDCPATSPTACRARPAISRRKPSPAPRPTLARISTPPASPSIFCSPAITPMVRSRPSSIHASVLRSRPAAIGRTCPPGSTNACSGR